MSIQKESLINNQKTATKAKSARVNAHKADEKGNTKLSAKKLESLKLSSNHNQTTLKLATNHNQTSLRLAANHNQTLL